MLDPCARTTDDAVMRRRRERSVAAPRRVVAEHVDVETAGRARCERDRLHVVATRDERGVQIGGEHLSTAAVGVGDHLEHGRRHGRSWLPIGRGIVSVPAPLVRRVRPAYVR